MRGRGPRTCAVEGASASRPHNLCRYAARFGIFCLLAQQDVQLRRHCSPAWKSKRTCRGPLHHASRGPPPPLRGGGKGNRSRGAFRARVFASSVARIARSVIRDRRFGFNAGSRISLRSIRATNKEREAERRQASITILRVLRRGARLAKRARLSAFHRGSRQRDYSSQRLGVRPCFLGLSRSARSGTAAPTGGRRPHAAPRVLPAPSCPSPASTSRAGHSAGRHDAQAARERSVSFRPRAPHSLRIGEYPRPKASVVERDSQSVTDIVT